jgi:DNA ligase (NAD+)
MEYIKLILENPYEEISKLTSEQLEIIIKLAADKYYNTSEPIISDTIYDILIDFLKLKNPKSKVLKEIGAKIKDKNKVKLDYWLGSMEKIKPEHIKEFEKWLIKYDAPYYISDKLDGISALIIYRNNSEINMYTRGTATEGLDISPLVKYLNIPSWNQVNDKLKMEKKDILIAEKKDILIAEKKDILIAEKKDILIAEKKDILIAEKKDILIAVRGELILPKKTFEKNWTHMKNARNTVSGLVNSKTINPNLAHDTKIIVYEIVDPFISFSEQMQLAENIGFDVVTYKKYKIINFKILSDYLKLRREESEFNVDGIIVTNNNKHVRNIKKNPEYAFAFKDILDDQVGITKVLNVEWNKSKDGYIKPTLVIQPINICGVEINRVTAYNAKYIVDNKIGINTEIEIIRSGDVIPKIQKIIKTSKKISLPEGKWHWNETNVDIISDDLLTDDILIKNIYYFFSLLDTKGLGEKIVEKLVNANFNTINKILLLNSNDIITIGGFKQKSADNLLKAIKNATSNINLAKFMSASNKLGHGIGEEKIKSILEKYPNIITDYNSWTRIEFINKIKEINGWEEKSSTQFVDNFDNFITFYNSVKDLITFEEVKEKKIIKSKYTDKIIVLSGFRDNELQNKLENMGAKITNSISKNTDYLIVKNESIIQEETGKVKKAKELGISIITKDNVL